MARGEYYGGGGSYGTVNPFAQNYPDLGDIDEQISKIQHNRLLSEDLRSQIEDRAAERAFRQQPLDLGGTAGGAAPATPAGTFEQKMGASEGGANPAAVNAGGYSGQFQFGAARLADLGLYKPAEGEDLKKNEWKGTFSIPGFSATTHEQFLASPAAQHAAFGQHVADIDKVITSTPGAERFDQNGLRAVAHLGGNAGMQRFISSGGLYDPADANGTRLSDYYKKFAAGGAPALQAAFGSPHGPGGPPQAAGVGPPQAPPPYQVATVGSTPPPPSGGATASPAPASDVAWLDEQAKTYPGLAGPNANPTIVPLDAASAQPGAPAPAAAAPAPAAPTPSATPAADAVPPPTRPPPRNALGLTDNDQALLQRMHRDPKMTSAGLAQMQAGMKAHGDALDAQYRTDMEQYQQRGEARTQLALTNQRQAAADAATAAERDYQHGRNVEADKRAADAAALAARAETGKETTQAATVRQKRFEQENTLRDEFQKLTGDFRVVQTSYENIRQSSKSKDGAGDMSLLYSYVRLLDPTSVVRESEFATAAASGSLGQRVQGAYERIASGGRMPDDLRENFVRESKHLYDTQLRSHNTVADQYEKLAKDNDLEPGRVVTRFARPQEEDAPAGQIKSDADFHALPSGAVFTDPNGQKRRKP